jgi:outer membrane biosynthesis protein TonB
VTLAGDRRSPAAWAGSLALHGAIVVAALFTVSHTLDIADQSAPVVPVDLVTIAQKSNVRASVRPQPKVAPAPTPPVPKAAPTPPPTQPQEAQQPQETPKEAPSETVAETPPAPAVPRHKPQPAQDQQNKNFDVDKVLALLNKVAPAPGAAPKESSANRTIKGIGEQTSMTADLQALLSSQIKPCWSPPVGAPHPVIVDFEVFLSPDGSVAQPPQLLANSGDPYFRAAAEAARRAIYSCAPYRLPADRYNLWRDINYHFDPSEMMGD